MPVPTNKKEILRVLAVCGFYRKCVPNFSDVTTPLTQLLKKDVKFVWSEKCQEAFDRLKAILSNNPVLKAPDFSRPFKMAVDASDVGVGAVLLQEGIDGIEQPISYFSRKLNEHQRNMCYSASFVRDVLNEQLHLPRA